MSFRVSTACGVSSGETVTVGAAVAGGGGRCKGADEARASAVTVSERSGCRFVQQQPMSQVKLQYPMTMTDEAPASFCPASRRVSLSLQPQRHRGTSRATPHRDVCKRLAVQLSCCLHCAVRCAAAGASLPRRVARPAAPPRLTLIRAPRSLAPIVLGPVDLLESISDYLILGANGNFSK